MQCFLSSVVDLLGNWQQNAHEIDRTGTRSRRCSACGGDEERELSSGQDEINVIFFSCALEVLRGQMMMQRAEERVSSQEFNSQICIHYMSLSSQTLLGQHPPALEISSLTHVNPTWWFFWWKIRAFACCWCCWSFLRKDFCFIDLINLIYDCSGLLAEWWRVCISKSARDGL